MDVDDKETGSIELDKFKFKIELEKIVIQNTSGKTEELIISEGPFSNGMFVAMSEDLPSKVVFLNRPFLIILLILLYGRGYILNCSKF